MRKNEIKNMDGLIEMDLQKLDKLISIPTISNGKSLNNVFNFNVGK